MQTQDEILQKIGEDRLTSSDIPFYYELYCDIAKNSNEIQEDIKGWNATIYFECGDHADHWVKIEDGTVCFGQGKIRNPEVIYKVTEDSAVKLLSGESDTFFEIYHSNLFISGNLFNNIFYILNKINILSRCFKDSNNRCQLKVF